MEKYQVKSQGKEPFKLSKENEILGTLNYPSSYNTLKAEIKLTNQEDSMFVKSPGIWKNNLELWKEDKCILSSKLGWNLNVKVRIQDAEYQLKVKNLVEGVFILQDKEENTLVEIDAEMDWTSAKAEFKIDILDKNSLFSPETILFLVHNCNYFLALSGNGGATEASLAATMGGA